MCERDSIDDNNNKDYFFLERKDGTNEMVANYQRGFKIEKLEQLRYTTKYKHTISKWYTLENAKKWSDWVRMFSGTSDKNYDKWCKNTGLFSAHFWGKCVSEDRMESLVKAMMLWFNNDDHTEYDEKTSDKYWNDTLNLLDICEGKSDVSMIEWTPYTTAIYIVFDNIFQKYSRTQVKRFINAYKNFIYGSLDEFKWRKRNNRYQSVEEWAEIRTRTIGMDFCVQLIEYSQDIELTDEEYNSEDFQNMLTAFVQQNMYAHEIGSLKKELNDTEFDYTKTFNGVVIIKNVRNVSLEEAIEIVLQIIKDFETEIEGYQKNLLESPHCSNAVKILINCLNTMTAGNIYVSTYIDRYINSFDPRERIYSDDKQFIQI